MQCPSSLGGAAAARAERVERRCAFHAEWQVTAAGFWTNMQMVLGAAAAGLAAISSGSAFSNQAVLAGSLAAAAALAAAVLAALRPGERADAHQKAASAYHALAVEAWQFRQDSARAGGGAALAAAADLESQAVQLAAHSPWAPRRLAKKTTRFLEKGESYYDTAGRAPPAP